MCPSSAQAPAEAKGEGEGKREFLFWTFVFPLTPTLSSKLDPTSSHMVET